MEEIVFIVKEDELEGGFTAAAVNYSIITEADNIESLKQNIREAIECHFDEAKPKIIHLHYTKQEIFSL
jgi:hypothetical protein